MEETTAKKSCCKRTSLDMICVALLTLLFKQLEIHLKPHSPSIFNILVENQKPITIFAEGEQ